jgi:hypothetical protein
MATVTPNYNWPVPTSTDFVKDGASSIEALGDAIDATVFGLPSGALTLINTTTFSAVASQSINDVFSATYDNYKIFIDCTHSAGGVGFSLRYRVGGADNSTANYQWTQVVRDNTTTSVLGVSGLNQTSASLGTVYGTRNAQEINVFSPFLASETLHDTHLISLSTSTEINRIIAGGLNLTTSFTGFTILPASGTITGTVRVYGVQN